MSKLSIVAGLLIGVLLPAMVGCNWVLGRCPEGSGGGAGQNLGEEPPSTGATSLSYIEGCCDSGDCCEVDDSSEGDAAILGGQGMPASIEREQITIDYVGADMETYRVTYAVTNIE